MKNMKRSVALLVAIALLIGCAAGGTMAWLTMKTEDVVNTFTTSDINITLEESDSAQDNDSNANTNSYKMVPGAKIAKNPTVTVEANSEACWLFVEVNEIFTPIAGTSYKFDDFLQYEIVTDNDNWTAGNGTGDGKNGVPVGVYYRQVPASNSEQSYGILKDNVVTVPGTVTKEMMNAVATNYPKLTFTASAHQLYENNTETFTAAEAWKNLNP